MDHSSVTAVAKDAETNKSKANVTNLSNRSGAGSIKSAIAHKTNDFSGKKFQGKSEIYTRNGPLKKPNQKDSFSTQQRKVESKISSSMASKSSSCLKLAAASRTKIPSIKKTTPLETDKTATDQRLSARQKGPGKSVQPKIQATKKQLQQKPETLENKVMGSMKTSPTVIPGKLPAKCQSSRSHSGWETLNLRAKKKSASNISIRSTPCSTQKELISAAGDCIEPPSDEKHAAKQEKVELLLIIPTAGCDVPDEPNCETETHEEPIEIDLKDDDIKESCDIEQLQPPKSNSCLLPLVEAETSSDKYKMELEETHKSLKQVEAKYHDFVQKFGEDRLELEKDLREKAEAEIAKKDEDIKELQTKAKAQDKQVNNFKVTLQNCTLGNANETIQMESESLRQELKTCRDGLASTNKKLQDREQQLKQEKRDVESKTELIEKLESDIQKLEKDLTEMSTKLEVLQSVTNKKAQTTDEEQLFKQISELSQQVSGLEMANDVLKKQNEKLKEETLELGKLRRKLTESGSKLKELQKECERKEKILEKEPDCSKECQKKLAQLRQNEAEKQRESEKLKADLFKTQSNICQLEQQVQRGQQLLDVRSGLINSLQKNEKSHRIQIEDLCAQLAEKNSGINELNCELQMKSEEFRKLFMSLSAKQMEVANQEHIIKLLEESNERCQMLRMKQEEKIGRLEGELANLKQIIAFYQAKILATNSESHVLSIHAPTPTPTNVNYNENFYYYISQRKRKRQIDINVKKYET